MTNKAYWFCPVCEEQFEGCTCNLMQGDRVQVTKVVTPRTMVHQTLYPGVTGVNRGRLLFAPYYEIVFDSENLLTAWLLREEFEKIQ